MNDALTRPRMRRRSLLMLTAASAVAWAIGPERACARGAWSRLEGARAAVGDATPSLDGLALDVPLLSENGASVPVLIRPETLAPGDFIETLDLFAPSNPYPLVATLRLTALTGRGEIATRIRLNESQTVIAVARLASGAVLVAERDVRITASGCLMVIDADYSKSLLETRVRVPKIFTPGKPGEVLTIISHPQETGLRKDASGRVLPKRLVERLDATLDGHRVLTVEFHRSVAANPYLRFFLTPPASGTLALRWTEDTGTTAEKSVAILVS